MVYVSAVLAVWDSMHQFRASLMFKGAYCLSDCCSVPLSITEVPQRPMMSADQASQEPPRFFYLK